jgi:hypothetical protein
MFAFLLLVSSFKRLGKFGKESLVGRVKHVFVWSNLHVPGKEGIQERGLCCVFFSVLCGGSGY